MPAPEPEPFVDSVCAGDAFSAYVLHGLIEGMDPSEMVDAASRFAAKVCRLKGAISSDDELYRQGPLPLKL